MASFESVAIGSDVWGIDRLVAEFFKKLNGVGFDKGFGKSSRHFFDWLAF